MGAAEDEPLGTAPLVGREGELAKLEAAFAAVQTERVARVVTCVGGAGTGKTALLREFVTGLTRRQGAPRVYQGNARGRALSYGVFARLLRARFGLSEETDPEQAAALVRREVAAVLDDRKVGDVCHFLGQLLGLKFEPSPLTRALADDPVQAQLLRRAIVRSFVEADATRSPLCLLFDNLHQADPDSVDLLEHLIKQLRAPILIVCLTHPELLARRPTWFASETRHHLRLDLGPLSNSAIQEIARHLLSRCAGGPPEELVQASVQRSLGNPGLAHQLISVFVDSGVLNNLGAAQPSEQWGVDLARLAQAELPATADDIVAARIAALSTVEERILGHAAVVGNVFWLGALVALARAQVEPPEYWSTDSDLDVQEIELTLKRLVRRDYVLRVPDSTSKDEVEYVFKHSLEREKLLARSDAANTRRCHQIIGDWLAQNEGTRSEEDHLATLSRHLREAGSNTRAGLGYLRAGDLARAAYAAKKAEEYYRVGHELLGDDEALRRIDALHNHGDVLQVLGRTDEALAQFRQMLALAYRMILPAKGGAAHNRIGRLYREVGSLSLAERHFSTALTLFEKVGDARGSAASRDDMGRLLWMRGDYDAALDQLKRALETRKELQDHRSIALSLTNIGLVWLDHGRASKAAEALEAALCIRREIDDPLGICDSLMHLGRLARDQGNLPRSLELLAEALEIAKDIGERKRLAVVLTSIGASNYQMKDALAAVAALHQAEQICDQMGDRLNLAEARRHLAEAYLAQGELRKAREAIKSAVDLFGKVRSKAHLAVALRTLGEVTGAGAWGQGHEGKAVDYFMRSIAICKEIGNELEVAKSYQAFSTYVSKSEHYKTSSEIQREAEKLQKMADEIFERHRRALANAENQPT